MNIQINNVSFGKKYPTVKILEITSQKILDNDGSQGFIETLKDLYPELPKYTGNRGFKYFAKIVGDIINSKYPEIAQASEDIREIHDSEPYMKSKLFKELVTPIIERFEKEIDIVI